MVVTENVWSAQKFNQRLFLIREVFNNFLETGEFEVSMMMYMCVCVCVYVCECECVCALCICRFVRVRVV